MSNMSYCRFQNTLGDMQECLDSVVEQEELSADEEAARDELIQTCRDFVAVCDESDEG